MTKPKAMTRQELYDLVWSEPVSKLAVRFDLSDKGLAKKCQRHDIPCPPPGYWAKLQNGHQVKPTPLPDNQDVSLATVVFWPRQKQINNTPKLKPHLSEEQFAAALTFKIPERVNRYHSVIAACRKAHKENDKRYALDNYGRIRFPRMVSNPGFKVTPDTFDRACLLMQGLITLCESIGWQFATKHSPRDEAETWGFKMGDEILEIEVKEAVKKMQPTEREQSREVVSPARRLMEPDFSFHFYPYYKSTGNLELSIDLYSPGFQVRWKDNGSELIEHQLGAIAQGFSRAFEHSRLQTIENEKWRKEYERNETERKEKLRLQHIEEKRREHLFTLAEYHHKVNSLKYLITALEAREKKDERLEGWLSWAKGVADAFDPLREPERILEEYDAIAQRQSYNG